MYHLQHLILLKENTVCLTYPKGGATIQHCVAIVLMYCIGW